MPDLFADVPEAIREVYMDWVKMRTKIKKPITSKTTVTRSLNRLTQLTTNVKEQKELIQLAIDNCWQSFYKPSNAMSRGQPASQNNQAWGEIL